MFRASRHSRQLIFPLEKHSVLQVQRDQPKQGISSCTTPLDISPLPCTGCWTGSPQSTEAWAMDRVYSKGQEHQIMVSVTRLKPAVLSVKSLNFLWYKKNISVSEDWLVTSLAQEGLYCCQYIGLGVSHHCSPARPRASSLPGLWPNSLLTGTAKPGHSSTWPPWGTGVTHPKSFLLPGCCSCSNSLVSTPLAVNQTLSILGNKSYFEQWGPSPSSSWKPKVTKLLLKISRGAFVDYVTQQVFRI